MMKFLRFLKGLLALALIGGVATWVANYNRDYRNETAWGLTINDSTGKWRFHHYKRMSPKQIEKVFSDRMKAPKELARRLSHHLLKTAQEYGFDPAIILSLIQAESSFRPRVVSNVGARGLMQVMPATARYISRLKNLPYRNKIQLFDPFMNITVGTAYLSYLRKHYKGEFKYFLAAYNAGPGRVDKAIRGSRKVNQRYEPKVTKPYIEKIRFGVKAWRGYGTEGRDQSEDLRVIQRLIDKVNRQFSLVGEARAEEKTTARSKKRKSRSRKKGV